MSGDRVRLATPTITQTTVNAGFTRTANPTAIRFRCPACPFSRSFATMPGAIERAAEHLRQHGVRLYVTA